LAIKNPWVCTQGSLPSKLLSLDLLRPFGLEKPNGFERILAHRIDCQRARASCPAERLPNNQRSIWDWSRSCQHLNFQLFEKSTAFLSFRRRAEKQASNDRPPPALIENHTSIFLKPSRANNLSLRQASLILPRIEACRIDERTVLRFLRAADFDRDDGSVVAAAAPSFKLLKFRAEVFA